MNANVPKYTPAFSSLPSFLVSGFFDTLKNYCDRKDLVDLGYTIIIYHIRNENWEIKMC